MSKRIKDALAALRMHCLRCGHTWLRKSELLPLVCPRCKSPYYNRPRRK